MKVLVVGSNDCMLRDGADTTAKAAAFQNACQDIGRTLAKAGVHFVLGSLSPNTADQWVLQGAASVEGQVKVTFIRPEKRSTVQLPTGQDVKAQFVVSYARSSGNWIGTRLAQVLAADCVLAIGGHHGTAQACHSAIALEKPVITVPSFGGTAADVWPQLQPYYANLGELKVRVANLAESWQPGNAQIVVDALKALWRQRAFSRPRVSEFLPLTWAAVLFCVWVWLFVSPPTPLQASFFALLAVSSLLGTVLRGSLRRMVNPGTTVSRQEKVAEHVAGLVLALGLALLFLAGSITFKGDLSAAQDLTDFQRIAVPMGLIGLTGGWLLERIAPKIADWLADKVPSA